MEDAEQEILIKLLTVIHSFQFKSSFKTFFYRFSHNQAIDILRKKKRENKNIIPLRAEHFSLKQSNPEDVVLKNEQKQDTIKALLQLKEEERSIILLKEVENLKIKEISAITGLPSGTIKSKLHRIRDKLASYLQGGSR